MSCRARSFSADDLHDQYLELGGSSRFSGELRREIETEACDRLVDLDRALSRPSPIPDDWPEMLRGHWLYLAGRNAEFDVERFEAIEGEIHAAISRGWKLNRDGQWCRL